MDISNCIENAQSTIVKPSLNLNFESSGIHFLNVVMHILFVVILGIIVWISVIPLKTAKVRLEDQARDSILNHQEFISLNLVMHILFVVILGIIVWISVISWKCRKDDCQTKLELQFLIIRNSFF